MVDAQQCQLGGWGPGADKPSVNLGECVAGLINAVDKGMADEVAPYNLIPLEFGILRICLQRGECTATQLAEVLPTDASRISRMVTRLVNIGLLRRRRLRNDRRVVMLRLTEKGNELTFQVDQRVKTYDAKLVEGISDEEMQVFASITFRIISNYATLRRSA